MERPPEHTDAATHDPTRLADRSPDAGSDPGDDGRTAKEMMLAGELYIPDEEILAEQVYAHRLMQRYNASEPDADEERRRLLEQMLGSIGADTVLRPPFYCDFGYHIRIGARTFANFGLVALDVARIQIGDDVQIGPNVQLLTPTHPVDPGPRRAKWEAAEPITIGDNVWLGGGVIVCPGVTIGDDTVVGAGSVVVDDLPARVVAVGNPARVVKSIPSVKST